VVFGGGGVGGVVEDLLRSLYPPSYIHSFIY
jgi:hypothetical protein